MKELILYTIFLSITITSCSYKSKVRILEKKLLECKTTVKNHNKISSNLYHHIRDLNKSITKKIKLINSYKSIEYDLSRKSDFLRICKKSLLDEKSRLSFCNDKVKILKENCF